MLTIFSNHNDTDVLLWFKLSCESPSISDCNAISDDAANSCYCCIPNGHGHTAHYSYRFNDIAFTKRKGKSKYQSVRKKACHWSSVYLFLSLSTIINVTSHHTDIQFLLSLNVFYSVIRGCTAFSIRLTEFFIQNLIHLKVVRLCKVLRFIS